MVSFLFDLWLFFNMHLLDKFAHEHHLSLTMVHLALVIIGDVLLLIELAFRGQFGNLCDGILVHLLERVELIFVDVGILCEVELCLLFHEPLV